jgi:hypothetical protein
MSLIKDLRQSNAAFAAGVFIISGNTEYFGSNIQNAVV